jgi:hypothetical protein
MTDIWLQKTAKTARRAVKRTEPDLHLIKQVEQVTTLVLEALARRFAWIRSIGTLGAVVSWYFQIGNYETTFNPYGKRRCRSAAETAGSVVLCHL